MLIDSLPTSESNLLIYLACILLLFGILAILVKRSKK